MKQDRDWTIPTFDDCSLSLVDSGAFGGDHPGMAFVSQHRKEVGELVRRIGTALERNRDRDLAGEVVYA